MTSIVQQPDRPERDTPLFTVIIPTLNRWETLKDTLESCVRETDQGLRILVSDNLSDDRTQEIVREFVQRDARVSCVQPPSRLGVSRHWEFAITQVQEGFVMVLGSDDALMPTAVSRARKLLEGHPDVLVLHGEPTGVYVYPSFENGMGNRLVVTLDSVGAGELRCSEEWLHKAARAECDVVDLPVVYQHSFVHVSVLQKIIAVSGGLIHSVFPDYFLAVAVATQVDSYLHCAPGFSLPGTSGLSLGAAGFHPGGNRELEKAFKADAEIPYHPAVGEVRSVHIAMGETLLRISECGLLKEAPPIAWDRMVAKAMMQFHTEGWSEAEKRHNVKTLQELAHSLGCAHILPQDDSSAGLEAWAKQLDFPLNLSVVTTGCELNGQALSIKGVHHAAMVAEEMMLLCQAPTSQEEITCQNVLAHSLITQVQGLRKHAGGLATEVQNLREESRRRGQERDGAKRELARLKEKSKQRQGAEGKRQPKARSRVGSLLHLILAKFR